MYGGHNLHFYPVAGSDAPGGNPYGSVQQHYAAAAAAAAAAQANANASAAAHQQHLAQQQQGGPPPPQPGGVYFDVNTQRFMQAPVFSPHQQQQQPQNAVWYAQHQQQQQQQQHDLAQHLADQQQHAQRMNQFVASARMPVPTGYEEDPVGRYNFQQQQQHQQQQQDDDDGVSGSETESDDEMAQVVRGYEHSSHAPTPLPPPKKEASATKKPASRRPAQPRTVSIRLVLDGERLREDTVPSESDSDHEYKIPSGKSPRSLVAAPPKNEFRPAMVATLKTKRSRGGTAYRGIPGVNRAAFEKLDEASRPAKCMESLARYIEACGGSATMVDNWRATIDMRKEGSTAGTFDVYYFDESGRRYRSRAEVARALELAAPVRPSKAAKVPTNLGFGNTKKAKRRAAHARRFAVLTAPMRASLASVLSDVDKREKAKLAAAAALATTTAEHQRLQQLVGDRTSNNASPLLPQAPDSSAISDDAELAGFSSGNADGSKLDRLRIRLREHQAKLQSAKQSLEMTESILTSATAATENADANLAHAQEGGSVYGDDDDDDELSEEEDADDADDVEEKEDVKQEEEEEEEVRSDGKKRKSVAKLDRVAKKKRLVEEKATKDAERERKAFGRLEKATTRLEELVLEAETAAEKRMATETDRRRKRAAKEAEVLAKRAEREADLEARRERREREAANRKRERDDELEARRLERDAEMAASAAAKARAELDRKLQQRYPIEDLLLGDEPPREPPLPPRPAPHDPTEDILRAVPEYNVGDVLSAHSLLSSAVAFAAREAASAEDADTPRLPADETPELADLWPDHPQSIDAFASALVAPISALAGRRSALRPLRIVHAALLKLILDDPSCEVWWPQSIDHPDVQALVQGEDDEDDEEDFEDSRYAASPYQPWSLFSRRFASKHRELEDASRVDGNGLSTLFESAVTELRRGSEKDTETRKWIAAVEECETSEEAVVDAVRCAARLTTLPSLRAALNAAATQARTAPAEVQARVLEFAQTVRATRPRTWRGAAAEKEAAALAETRAAAEKWTKKYSRLIDDEEDPMAGATPERNSFLPRTGSTAMSSSRATSDDDDEDDSDEDSESSAPRLEDGWRVNGSEYVGRRVRRSVLDDDNTIQSHSDGVVAGWLPAEESDYLNSDGKPAALWHVKLETGELAGDEEDLELDELLESLVPSDGNETLATSSAPPPLRLSLRKEDDVLSVVNTSNNHRGRSSSFAASDTAGSSSKKSSASPAVKQRKSKPKKGAGGSKRGKGNAGGAAKGKKRQRASDASQAATEAGDGPFPRTELAEALAADAVRRRKPRKDDEETLDATYAFPRPPSEAVGASTWTVLSGAVVSRLAARDADTVGHDRPETAAEKASRWLSEGLPYGGLSTSERIALLKCLCDAYAATKHCARLLDAAAEERATMETRWEAEDRERKRRAAEKERETSAAVRERLGLEAQERATFHHQQKIRSASPASASQLTDDQKKPAAKKPRPRPGAAPPPLSAALDRLIALDAPVSLDQRNPKMPGSRCHMLYDRYREGTSIGQILMLGARRGDIFNDLARGYCVLTLPEHAALYVEAARSKTSDVAAAAAAPVAESEAPPPSSASATDEQQVAQPTRHRFRAEVTHARAVEACGGGEIEFVASLTALERRESASIVQQAGGGVAADIHASTAALRASRQRAIEALRRATEAGDVGALRAAVAHAKRDEVRLEGRQDDDPNKRWIVRELVDAYEALRDAELRAEEDARRRGRAAERRDARALPRIEPLGTDRDHCVYWTFPRRKDPVVRVWSGQRPTEASPNPSWNVFVGEDEIRDLAASLDDRGVRERELRAALLDLVPPAASSSL